MSQESTDPKYPRDRFDDIEPYTTQQGAHRKEFAAPKGTGHLNAIIIAGGIALAIGVASYLWLLPSDPLDQAGSAPETAVSQAVDDEPQDAEETIEPEAVQESATTDPEQPEDPAMNEAEDAEDTAEPESDEAVDHELPISVYNASDIQGHAASVAQELGGAGFNVPVADDWGGAVPASTTVYFSGEEATAGAVADQLDANAVYEPSVDGVLVVLTGD